MIDSNKSKFSFVAILSVTLGLSACPVFAQESDDEDRVVEEVIVTGSRISQDANLTSSSPVSTIDATEFEYSGIVRVEDLLNRLPQVYSAQESGQSNGATGTATVELRNLGTVRTLVLLNGRRLPPGSPIQGGYAPDLNQIPSNLIKRVEILTGGASATYGSDAVSGVINFILDDEFSGVTLQYQRGFYQHNNDNSDIQALLTANNFDTPDSNVMDGFTDTYTMTFGTALGRENKGHMVGYLTYRNIDSVLQGNRDYSTCDLGGLADRCGGSSTIPDGRFTDFNGTRGRFALRSNGQPYTVGGELAVFSGFDFIPGRDGSGDPIFVNRDGLLFNYNPTNFYQRPDERYSGGFMAKYKVNDRLEWYSDFSFSDNHTDAQIAYSGAFFVTEDLFCGNPFLTDAQFQSICGQFGLDRTQNFSDLKLARFVEAGPNDTQLTVNGQVVTRDFDDDPATPPTAAKQVLLADTQDGSVLIGKRNIEGGPRSHNLRHTAFSGTFGVRGDLDDVWRYDAYFQRSEVSLENTYNNDLSTIRIRRALDVVSDPVSGDPVCRSVIDESDPGCVPWNVFRGNIGLQENLRDGVTQEALDYIYIPLYARGTTEMTVMTAYVAGDLGEYGIRLPSARNGVSVVLGIEYRNEDLDYSPDLGFQSGDGAGQGGATLSVDGGVNVTEYFAEASIPLAEELPLAELVNLDLAYRYSDYSTGVTASTYRLAAQWIPVDAWRVRASLQRAIRHPNVRELFLPQGNNLFNGNDICSGDAVNVNGTRRVGVTTNPDTGMITSEGYTFEQCARSGVTQAQFGTIQASPADQYNFLQGGSTDLKQEEADTFSIGVGFTPEAVPGLSVSVDWFDIEVNEAIAIISPQTILEKCVEDNILCEFVNRGTFNGDLWVGGGRGTTNNAYIESLNTNIGFLNTSGIDVNAVYDLPLGSFGNIRFQNDLTYLLVWDQEEFPGAGVDDCLGRWSGGCGNPTMETINRFRTTWYTPWNLDLTAAWRYIGAVDSLDPSQVDLDEINYLDVSAVYRLLVLNFDVQFNLGVNNVLDTEPPLVGTATATDNNGNTFPGYYDALGRYVFLAVSVGFK